MRTFFVACLLAGMMFSPEVFGQVGERVRDVRVLNMSDDTVSLPYFGQKNLLIFYADPSHPRQNKKFRNYLKEHPITGPELETFGVINLAAAPMLPNGLIRRMALRETAGTDAQLYLDPDHVLSDAWHLPGANDNFTVIFVNRNGVIEFYKAGQLSNTEQQDLLALMRKSAGN